MQNKMILTPFFLDQPVPGLMPLAGADWQINSVDLPNGDTQDRMTLLHRSLAAEVATAVANKQRPISIAGDCCTTLGVLAGLHQTDIHPTLIWFDAHGDFNDWQTTPSGFLGGMPLAMIAGIGQQKMVKGVGLQPLPSAQIWLTDGRDLDPGEKKLLAESDVTHLSSVTQLLDIKLPPGMIYVHFDVDVLDPADAPAMNYPAAGGPTVDVVRAVFKRLAASGQIVAVSVSAWNPDMAGSDRTQEIVLNLLAELIA